MNKFFFLLLFVFAACTNEATSPENALKDFMELRMGNVVTREAVLEKLTGPMRVSLENTSEEDFVKFADMRNVERESFKILSKSCTGEKCFVTYTLTYKTKQNDQTTFTTEVKKIAEVVKADGKWLIADVSNIKTYHEAAVPIDAMGDKAQ